MPMFSLPPLAIVVPLIDHVVWISEVGEVETIDHGTANTRLNEAPALFAHRAWTAERLGRPTETLTGLDVLELFAFVRPARFAVPTAAGLAGAVGIEASDNAIDTAARLPAVCQKLLAEMAEMPAQLRNQAAGIAAMMTEGGWSWGKIVLAALDASTSTHKADAAIWSRLDTIPDIPPRPQGKTSPINAVAAAARLKDMTGKNAPRPEQEAYSVALYPAFNPKTRDNPAPNIVLAEAGTGVGKTLGYLAPATVWAEENDASVWVSTYTRNLQHQVEDEMSRLHSDPQARHRAVAVRKGRENYLCLLNLEEALNTFTGRMNAVGLGLMARWAEASGDGDLTSNHFPAWLTDLFGYAVTAGLSDRRGECIHSACPHYKKCFVELSAARARQADIVIVNHALVMTTTMMNVIGDDSDRLPFEQIIFDEGHHLFEAADSVFSVNFCLRETADLRRWIDGGNNGASTRRGRGLRHRVTDLIKDAAAESNLEAAVAAAAELPGQGWSKRLFGGMSTGAVEDFLVQARQVVLSKSGGQSNFYSLEIPFHPTDATLLELAPQLSEALTAIAEPLEKLARYLKKAGNSAREEGNTQLANQSEAIFKSVMRRAIMPLGVWRALIDSMTDAEVDQDFVDLIRITRKAGEDRDIGVYRHFLDPSETFNSHVLSRLQGAVITSATLTDRSGTDDEPPDDVAWQAAKHVACASHLEAPPILSSVASPFDYAAQTRVFIVTDHDYNDLDKVAEAMAQLMCASDGSALGLFTAITRLTSVYPDLARRLWQEEIPLYAQHGGAMTLATLLQIFRSELRSCLLGTDAARDGIDVPGEALRLIIFDRVPWPRQDILFKARAEAMGRNTLTDRLVRMKLRQAFGRLIRRKDDRGVFVMLDGRLPNRLLSAFPAGAPIEKLSLAETVAETRSFLATES